MIVHNVFFALKDNTLEAKNQLLESCKTYLTGHPGTRYFAVGTLAHEINRPVNDRDFDVALLIVFENQAAHDRYQQSSKHLEFIEKNRTGWKKVRVFDSET